MSTKTLSTADIKTFLEGLSHSIELDQIYVDSLPRKRFSKAYDDGLWRDWRRDHRAFIDKLIASADRMSPSALRRLTEVALSFDPAVVEYIMLETFAGVVGGAYAENCETAQRFFKWVRDEVVRQGRGKRANGSAMKAISKWRSAVDPLLIAQDPECGYPVRRPRARSRRNTNRPAA
ncbi:MULTISPECIES: hypothetical protein [Bradyrhizobium]|uniref:hypothetical protein n=1 Tax=Bradyrhizobium TaxID=374 RepID=UPI0021693222|nr:MULTISPECIES: hypothetical protein [Bradyrhizobium]MCS3765269.1 hypothetical protein [Bradyrhizobium centrosematis]MCS3774032.1 hypothetical protein [Bradyrhizobium centrosematis]MDT4740662.1 hypothetical protein [Bradyrhizobium sp. WYCCWR 12699]